MNHYTKPRASKRKKETTAQTSTYVYIDPVRVASYHCTYIETLLATDRPQVDVAILAARHQNASRFAQIQTCHLLRVRLYLIWGAEMVRKNRMNYPEAFRVEID